MLAPGHKIGPYTVHECAGEGGMARVYKVWHDGLHRFEALKTPRGSHGGAPDSAYVTRLLAEARVAASLHHPNIVGIHNVSDPATEIPFFTMDWVEGLDLAKIMAERGTFSLEETIEILEPVAAALDYAHEHGIVHRDVKPANILLGELRGALVPRVVDFGISRAAEDEDGATKLTKSGMLVGTPEYMSPEQSGSGAPVDFHSDIYSLGVVAFEMLCGRPPFTAGDGVSRLSILVAHVRDTAPLWDHVPHFPRHSGEVLLRALSKSPEARYPNCSTFIAELKKASEADGPFTAFVYDENGQRTPFDASRFAPVDAATLMEKPGGNALNAPAVPPTRPIEESAPTHAEPSTDTFLSLAARLNAPKSSPDISSNATPSSAGSPTPKAKVLARDTAPVEAPVSLPKSERTTEIEPSASNSPASRLGLPVQGARPSRTRSFPSAAMLAVLATLIVSGGLAWVTHNRVTKAVSSVAETSAPKTIKAKPLVEVTKASETVPVPKALPTTQFKQKSVIIPFDKEVQRSDNYPVGYNKVTRKGVAGQKLLKWSVTYQGQKLIKREPQTETITLAPKSEITVVGTRTPIVQVRKRYVARIRPRITPRADQKRATQPRFARQRKSPPKPNRRIAQRPRSRYVPLPP